MNSVIRMPTDTRTALNIVHEYFGVELGDWLMDNNKIIPVRADKSPACRSWKEFRSHDLKFYRDLPISLAVIPNERFHILDIDDHGLVFGSPNVTTAKGAHYWFSGGSFTKTEHHNKLDILVSNYAVFYGLGKQFHHSVIHSWNDLIPSISSHISPSLLPSIAGNDDRKKSQEVVIGSMYRKSVQGTYREQVKRKYGVEVDTEKVMKGYVSTMKKAKEGSRNVILYRLSLEAYRLGADLSQLELVAYETGLDSNEIEACMESARGDYEMGPSATVMDRVEVWYDEVIATGFAFTDDQLAILAHIRNRAIEDNTRCPQINQLAFAQESGISRFYINRALKSMAGTLHILEVERPKGLQANGNQFTNNYYLCLNGVRIENLDKQIDVIIQQNQDTREEKSA